MIYLCRHFIHLLSNSKIIKSCIDNSQIIIKFKIDKTGRLLSIWIPESNATKEDEKFLRANMQMIFQDPMACLNPRKKIALIGKGICFDSGGLDIKPASSMLTMKDDMSGAACVIGVMSAIKEFSPDVEVHGIIAACENMPGCSAYKPGDILTAKNGKTIEVDNTDAEGRLTLADALCYADELGVDEIIDLATLTGACMVALGNQAAGIVGNDDALVKSIIETAKNCGERYWELPMYEEYKESLKSSVADMQNTGSRWGGASTAGLFLKEFVEKTKWAHIDIAGVAYFDKPQGEFIKGSTGAGVRAMINYVLK